MGAVDLKHLIRAAGEYSDAHRELLQEVMTKGQITKKEFYLLYLRLSAVEFKQDYLTLKGVNKETIADLVSKLLETINKKVKELCIRLVKVDGYDGNEVICFISEFANDEDIKEASWMESDERFLFTSWVDQMMRCDEGTVDVHEAYRQARALPNPIAAKKIDDFIDQLQERFWITVVNQEYLTLGSRGVAELGALLRRKYLAPGCSICERLVVRRAACVSCPDCDGYIHGNCWRKWAKASADTTVRCPASGCKATFDKAEYTKRANELDPPIVIKEETVEEKRRRKSRELTNIPPMPERSGPSTALIRPRNLLAAENENGEEDDDEIDVSDLNVPPITPQRTSSRRRASEQQNGTSKKQRRTTIESSDEEGTEAEEPDPPRAVDPLDLESMQL